MPRPLPIAAGAAAGLAGWMAFAAVREALPVWLRLAVAAVLLVFGPGAGLMAPLLAPLARLPRLVLAFAFGLALGPALAHALGVAHAIAVYPYIAAALGGGAIGLWWTRRDGAPAAAGSARAALLVSVIALSMGAVAFGHRLETVRGGTIVNGDYDSYDLSYYAAIGAELSHTVPPASPFFSGRELNHGFYPHVALGLLSRFGGVPILDLYFRYAWPLFLLLAMLACFVFVESIADTRTATLAAILFGTGSNLAYLAVWLWPQPVWDNLVWSHNFQGAGAEVLFYGNWTPALAVIFAGLYALGMACRPSRPAWAIVAGAVLATSLLAKPWFFAIVLSALVPVIVFGLRDRFVVRRLLLVATSALVVAAPLLYRTFTLSDDAQVTLASAYLPIPLRMADRIGLGEWLTAHALNVAVASTLALPIFLISTIGFRVVGLRAWWQALRPGSVEPVIWRVLAWSTMAALVAASVVVTVPYHETTQIHQSALFLMTLFAARALGSMAVSRTRAVATAVVLAAAVPCTLHYLQVKWTDNQRPPIATATPGDLAVASALRAMDPESTVVLHDNPGDPQIVNLVSARRSVVSWGSPDYVRGSEARRADVEAFFSGADTARALSILRAYKPTHLIEHRQRDRIDPELLGQLELVLRTGDVALYRVPERVTR